MSAHYVEAVLDAHVHYHPEFPLPAFLDAASHNLRAGCEQLRLGGPTAGTLMFTESADDDAFSQLESQAIDATAASPASEGWWFRRTNEPLSLWAERPDGALLVIAGRQIVTHERLEVLALGCRESIPDGLDVRRARDTVIEAGGVPVIPWGFGKWWFRRGQIVADLLRAAAPGRWYLGDNAGRPRGTPRPRLFARAAAHGVFVLPGSDPLPLPGQHAKVGRCGFLMPAGLDPDRPAKSILEWLAACDDQPRTFGRLEGWATFGRHQIAMQKRKRREPAAERP